MQKISDIYELARLLIENGNPPRFSRANLPDYQAAIQKALPSATNSLVDELGFVDDKDACRCYLTKPIDFMWLEENVFLEPPLLAVPKSNRIYGEERIEILGGSAEGMGAASQVKQLHRSLWQRLLKRSA